MKSLKARKYLIEIGAALACLLFVSFQVYALEDYKEVQQLLAKDGSVHDQFGYSVSISDDGATALAGSYLNDDNGGDSGSAYIFKYNGNVWTEMQKLLASDGAVDDHFGCSVSISGDGNTAIIGAMNDDDNGKEDSGSVYIFKYNGNVWTEMQKLTAGEGDMSIGDNFGYSVSISNDGNRIIVGKKYRHGNSGVHIFKYNGTAWVKEEVLLEIDYDERWAVSISGDGNTAIVGVNRSSIFGWSSGSAHIVVYNGDINKWEEKQELDAHYATGTRFGCSVSISDDGNMVIVGASNDVTENPGSAYIYKLTDGEWIGQKLEPEYGYEKNGTFGYSVSISGDGNKAIVGSYAGWQAGNFYVFASTDIFKFNGSTWERIQELRSGYKYDYFGWSVSLSKDGSIAIIGSTTFDSTGAVYIFQCPSQGEFSTSPKTARFGKYLSPEEEKLLATPGPHEVQYTVVGTVKGYVIVYDHKGNVLGGWPKETDGSSIINAPLLADINYDGVNDIIVCTSGKNIFAFDINGNLLYKWALSPEYINISCPTALFKSGLTQILVACCGLKEGRFVVDLKIITDGGVRDLASIDVNGLKKATMAIGDINNDSFDEIVVLVTGISDSGVDVMVINSDNGAIMSQRVLAEGSGAKCEWENSIAIGDIDKGAYWEDPNNAPKSKEIIVSLTEPQSDGTNKVLIHVLDQACNALSFSPIEVIKNIKAPIESSVVLGDINRSKQLELIVGLDFKEEMHNFLVYAYNYNGTGLMGKWPIQAGYGKEDSSPCLITGDADNNEYPDIIGGYGNEVKAWDYNGTQLQDWPKNIGDELLHSESENITPLAWADLEEDGKVEIVTLSRNKINIFDTDINFTTIEWPYGKHNYNQNCYECGRNNLPHFVNPFNYSIGPITYYTVSQGEELKFSVVALDKDKNYIKLYESFLPQYASFTTVGLGTAKEPGLSKGIFAWIPGFDQEPGDYTVYFMASDDIDGPVIMPVVITVKEGKGIINVLAYKLVDGAWAPFKDVLISLYEKDSTLLLKQEPTDANGKYDLIGIEEGNYRVKAWHSEYIAQEQEVLDLKRGYPRTVIFRMVKPLTNPGKMEGIVYGADTNLPLKKAVVYIDDRSVETGDDGSYSIEISSGTYNNVKAAAGGYKTSSPCEVAISKDKVTKKDFKLEKGISYGDGRGLGSNNGDISTKEGVDRINSPGSGDSGGGIAPGK